MRLRTCRTWHSVVMLLFSFKTLVISIRIFGRKQRLRKMLEIPPNHSAFFAPKIQPTTITAVDAFALAALTFFDRGGVK